MKIRTFVSLAVLAATLQGCGPSADGARSGAEGAQAGTEGERSDAEFRLQARWLYAEVARPSCVPAAKGFDRAASIEKERADVLAFDDGARGTPLQSQLDIARADAALELVRKRSCYADHEIEFARKHVEWTQKYVESGLRNLQELAPAVREIRGAGDAPAREAAEFRFQARQLVEGANRVCAVSAIEDNDAIQGPARAEISRFRQRLSGTPYAVHFDVAEADVAYEQSGAVVQCGAPDRSPPDVLRAQALAEARRQIASLDAIMAAGGSSGAPAFNPTTAHPREGGDPARVAFSQS